MTTRSRLMPNIGIVFDRPDRSHHLAEGLCRRGFRVTLYNNVPGSTRHVPIPRTFAGGLAYLTRRTHHDVYMTSASFSPAVQLYCNRWITGRPYVFTLNGAIWQFFKDRRPRIPFRRLLEGQLYPRLLARIFGSAGRIVCNSHYLRTALVHAFPNTANKAVAIHNGIDLEKFAGPPAGDPNRLMSVMTLDHENKSRGASVLLDAVDQILSARPDAHLTLAVKTRNPKHDRQFQQHLEAKQNRNRITLFRNHPDVASLLRASGMFLFAAAPDSDHSLPRALLEAQAVGLPVVTTGTAGCGEIVVHGKTGFTVPYRPEDIAHATLQLLDNPALAKTFGEQARTAVQRTFSWETMADRYRDVFLDVLDESRHYRSPAASDDAPPPARTGRARLIRTAPPS